MQQTHVPPERGARHTNPVLRVHERLHNCWLHDLSSVVKRAVSLGAIDV
jgi:hypothetical protein